MRGMEGWAGGEGTISDFPWKTSTNLGGAWVGWKMGPFTKQPRSDSLHITVLMGFDINNK